MLKLGIADFISFLEIAIAPTVPAFVAIYLSLYTVQAMAARETQRLAEIQIKELIKESRKEHYQNVRKQLDKLKNMLKPTGQEYTEDLSEFKLNGIKIEEIMAGDMRSGRLHLGAELRKDGKNDLDAYLDHMKSVGELNKNVDSLEKKVKDYISEVCSSYPNVKVSKQAEIPCTGAVINNKYMVPVIFEIWKEAQKGTSNTVNLIVETIGKPIPVSPKLLGELFLDKEIVKYGAISVANTDSFSAGIDVLKVMRGVLNKEDLKEQFLGLMSKRNTIVNEYNGIPQKIDDIVKRIDENVYSTPAVCCPYREYDEQDH